MRHFRQVRNNRFSRNIMPQTGAIDFSPLVLILLLQIVLIVLSNLALAY